jgi:hypothetical protein
VRSRFQGYTALAKLVGGSGIIQYRGLSLESKDGITVKAELDTFDVEIDGISKKADKRVLTHMFTITVTPTGKWTNPDRLFPYHSLPPGRLVMPVLSVTSINTTNEQLTVSNHQLYTGDRVMVGIKSGGTLPTSAPQVDEDTWYFARNIDANTITLHPTRADANANTNAINFSAAGSSVVIIGQFDLVVLAEDGSQISFEAAAISKQPDLDLSGEKTPFGEVEFKAFVRHRKRLDSANAFYTESTPGWAGWTAAASDILTQSPWVAWADMLAFDPSAINTTTNEITYTAHGLTDGQVVYINTTGTLPAATPALNPETKYYANSTGANTFSLHLTSADAIAGTNAIDFTSQGTGRHFVIKDNPPFSLIDTEVGVQISSPVEMEDRKSDRDGTYNARLTDCSMEAKLIPIGLRATDIVTALKLQGTGAARGRSLNSNSKALSIFSPGIFVRVNGASPKDSELAWNMSDDRVRDLTFVSTRVVTGGTVAAVGSVGTQAP